MNTTFILLLAALLVLVPILSVEVPRFRAIAAREEERAKKKDAAQSTEAHQTTKRALRTTLAILVGILLLFAYAVLIAYCLAWFLVYHTEARLLEARRGLTQGGEMRLCLCSRG
jgi:ABC-type Fe3+-siderophore transport system permease subunit